MPRNVACAHIPLFLTVLTKAVKMARMNVIFGIGHIYILCGRIHGNAVGYLNLLIGAVGDKVACEHIHLVHIYHGISHLVAHRNVAHWVDTTYSKSPSSQKLLTGTSKVFTIRSFLVS